MTSRQDRDSAFSSLPEDAGWEDMPDNAGDQRGTIDWWILLYALILIVIGVIMVFSASSVFAAKAGNATSYFGNSSAMPF